MNPAALKSNLHHVRRGGHLIINSDEFTKRAVEKVGYDSDPLNDDSLESYAVHPVSLTTLTVEALKGFVDHQEGGRAREEHVRPRAADAGCTRGGPRARGTSSTAKFGRKPEILAANLAAFEAGLGVRRDHRGLRRPVRGAPGSHASRACTATSPATWRCPIGLIAAAELSGLPLFLGLLPDHPGQRHPPRAQPAQGVRGAHPAARGRDRRHRRRPRARPTADPWP